MSDITFSITYAGRLNHAEYASFFFDLLNVSKGALLWNSLCLIILFMGNGHNEYYDERRAFQRLPRT